MHIRVTRTFFFQSLTGVVNSTPDREQVIEALAQLERLKELTMGKGKVPRGQAPVPAAGDKFDVQIDWDAPHVGPNGREYSFSKVEKPAAQERSAPATESTTSTVLDAAARQQSEESERRRRQQQAAMQQAQAQQAQAQQQRPAMGQQDAAAAEAEARSQAASVSASAWSVPATCRASRSEDHAVVTLISSNEGYPAGALAISAALEVLESDLRRISLVTPTVAPGIRELLRSAAWEVREVPEVMCNQVLGAGVTADRYDLGAEYQQKRQKWLTTCTKFHVWNLTFLKKVIFLDADTLVLRPIDELIDHPSDFAAAPDTFPADQFNSGVMVVKPSASRFEELLDWNRVNGTAEGGDQCLLNEFFGEWFYGAWDDPVSGRLPWIMNVAAASHEQYKTLSRMQSRDDPVVVHFVSDGKPWLYMVLKFQGQADRIPAAVRRLYHAWDQMYWLAKTNRICHGAVTAEEKQQARALLEAV